MITSILKALNTYCEGLSSYSEAKFYEKKDEDTWSLAQLYEHIVVTTNFFFFASTLRCIEQRKGQIGGEKNKNGERVFALESFPDIRVKLPEGVPQPENQKHSIETYKEQFNKLIVDAGQMAERLKGELNLDYKCEHPVFGWLNAEEWFKALEMHLNHHLKQKDRLES